MLHDLLGIAGPSAEPGQRQPSPTTRHPKLQVLRARLEAKAGVPWGQALLSFRRCWLPQTTFLRGLMTGELMAQVRGREQTIWDKAAS